MRRRFTTAQGALLGVTAVIALLTLAGQGQGQALTGKASLPGPGTALEVGAEARLHRVLYKGTGIDKEPLKHFPRFVAFIDSVAADGEKSYCTGVVIAADVVLTAGHCLDEFKSVNVRILRATNPSRYVTIAAKKWKSHPNFNGGYVGAPLGKFERETSHRFADLGLIVLARPVAGVEPAVFAPPSFDPAGSTAWMFVFGHGRDDNRRLNGNLEFAELQATEQIGKSGHYVANLKSGQGWCKRDSGGPVTVGAEGDNGHSRHYLLGIGFGFFNDLKTDDRPELAKIWGDATKIPGCGTRVGYTKIGSHTAWIEKTLKEMLPGEVRPLPFF